MQQSEIDFNFNLNIDKVAILGAGVMGAQIAAHFANCNFSVLLYDLPGRSSAALLGLAKLKPSPLVSKNIISRIKAYDYDSNLEDLKSCDLIIEAIAENLDIKAGLYSKIIKHINDTAIFCSNTSGLSINKLAEVLNSNKKLVERFCGVHFFNPPRYQKLVELIPHKQTNLNILNKLEEFLTRYLGKNIIRANDTPNFIANRIGVFSMLAAMHNAEKYNLSFDLVDILTGELIGRPKSATFRTADVVGLDTMLSVINTMYNQCIEDPWREFLKPPEYLKVLVGQNSLGQKTGKGFYFKNNKAIEIYDIKTNSYIDPRDPRDPGENNKSENNKLDNNLLTILKIKNPAEKFNKLKNYDHPQAQFLWSCFRDLWHYTAYHLAEISGCVRDVDLALCWGFGWKIGPFELWQAIGWQEVIKYIDEDVNSKSALVNISISDPVLNWINSDLLNNGVYKNDTAYNVNINKFITRSELSVYDRQNTARISDQNIVLENSDAKLWLYNLNNINNYVFSFKTKANILTNESIALLSDALDYINNNKSNNTSNNLVIWQDSGDNFCAGADLNGFMRSVKANDYITMDNSLIAFQNVCKKLRYANFPVVAAVRGMALGGGCELLLHCDLVVAALESYIGLVEVGVGVIPAGGGCKEMLRRANINFKLHYINNSNLADLDKITEQYYKSIATAVVSTSAVDALSLGYLRNTDIIVPNHNEILNIAVTAANNLVYCNYRSPMELGIKVGGPRIKANMLSMLINYLAGGFISEHDFLITSKLANLFCGSETAVSDHEVSEQFLLDLERKIFLDLLSTDLTQARITSLLTTGRVLKN